MEFPESTLIGIAIALTRQHEPNFEPNREMARIETGVDDAIRVRLIGFMHDDSQTLTAKSAMSEPEQRAYVVSFRAIGPWVERTY